MTSIQSRIKTGEYFQGAVISSRRMLELFKTNVMASAKFDELPQTICSDFLNWQPSPAEVAIWTTHSYTDK